LHYTLQNKFEKCQRYLGRVNAMKKGHAQ
jgi:hypothetical protein